MGQPKIWNDSEIVSTRDNDLHDGDLKVTGAAGSAHDLHIYEGGAWKTMFPRLDANGRIRDANMPTVAIPPQPPPTERFDVLGGWQYLVHGGLTTYSDVLTLRKADDPYDHLAFTVRLVYVVPNADVGLRFAINGPAADIIAYRVRFRIGDGSEIVQHYTAYDEAQAASVGSLGNVWQMATIEGVVSGAGAGAIVVRAAVDPLVSYGMIFGGGTMYHCWQAQTWAQ